MPGGFTSPAILFLSTWDAPERSFCKQVFQALPERGYTRYVEPCAGAFAMPVVAHAAGWKGPDMEASDTSLFSSIVGMMLDPTKDLADLQVAVDGMVMPLPHADKVEQAAFLLWLQLLIRTEVRPDVEYWRLLVQDIQTRQEEHCAAIGERLRGYMDKMGGMSYSPEDLWTHIERVADDPQAVVSINPPTYKGGFERFFDTKGRLTWAEPPYSVFDPVEGNKRLTEMMEGKPALILAQQQKEPKDCSHPQPVFARHLSPGQNVYLWSNRPEEIFEITGGPKVSPKGGAVLTPASCPILPMDYDVTDESKIGLHLVSAQVADYYRGLWMHRLNAEPGGMNVLITVDGHAAGVIGYSAASMQTPYNDRWSESLILRFAFGAPHDTLRLTRLATMIALLKSTPLLTLTPRNSIVLAAAEGLVTVEYTRHPEAKGLRGLMKLQDRQKHPDGHKLVYWAPWRDSNPEDTLTEFLKKEKQWQRSSSR
jgi:hypothetical protein